MNKYLEFKNKIDSFKNNKPTLLLHVCCGPCASYVIDFLKDYFDISIFYYNPNTYPEEEYIKRLDVLKELIDKNDYHFSIITVPYNHAEFLQAIGDTKNLPEGSKRCYNCYNVRIKKLAEVANENNFDYFTTVMSVSPYKNSDWINEIGEKYNQNSVFLYSNFKKENGYKKSIELSHKYNLYRQDYCGCEFSQAEHLKKINEMK